MERILEIIKTIYKRHIIGKKLKISKSFENLKKGK